MKGHLYLGSGVIDGTMKYTFYYKTKNGFKLRQIDYDNVTIKYTNGTPKCITNKMVLNDNILNKFIIISEEYIDSYEIYVPEGTIQNNYNLDAK